MYSQKNRLRKTCIGHSLKSAVSEEVFAVNTLKRNKYFRNLHQSPFIMFLHHYKGSWSWNISPTVRWNLRGVCYRLTADGKYPVQHCGNFTLPIQCNYLKNEMAFHNFLFHYLNLHKILNILKKRWLSKLMYFQIYRPWRTCLEICLKSAVLEHALTVNMWKRPKYLWNLHESAFILFFHHSHWTWSGKCLN